MNHPKASPFSKIEQEVGLSKITIEYSRPSAKGRTLFGNQPNGEPGLVPNGRIWRVGANESTKITFSTDVLIGGRKLPKGRGMGIAAHRSFLTYVATVVEVEVSEEGDLKIIKSWASIDAGTVVNTDTVKNQVQGGSIYGITAAISEGITFDNGRVQQSNFHDYRVPRMNDSPLEIEVEIVPSEAPPAGVGEPATPVYAPALCNAIFAACGKRIRQLPIGNQLKA